MAINVIFFIITLITLQNSVHSLNCNYCFGPSKSDCGQGKESSMAQMKCADEIKDDFAYEKSIHKNILQKMNLIKHTDEMQTVCVQLVYPVNGVPVFGRTCAVLPNVAPACELLQVMVNATHCMSCETNLCNSVPYKI